MAGTLDMAMAAVDATSTRPFVVNATRCVKVRNRNAPCNRCADACPADAVHISKQSIAIDWETCCSCLACTLACPTQALSNINPTDEQSVSTAIHAHAKLAAEEESEATDRNTSIAYLACNQAQHNHMQYLDPQRIGTIACLSQIDETLLINLAAAGARRVLIVIGNCETCSRFGNCGGEQAAFALARTSEKQANQVLSAYDLQIQLGITTNLPRACGITSERDYSASRRNMFGQIKGSMANAVSAAVSQRSTTDSNNAQVPSIYEQLRVNGEGTLPVHVPARRTMLLQALRQLGTPDDVLWNVRLWGYPVVNEERCIGCGMCSTFCPTGALNIIQSDASDEESQESTEDSCYEPEEPARLLTFRTDLCIKCRTCSAICIAQAIEFSEEVFAQDVASERIDVLKVIEANS